MRLPRFSARLPLLALLLSGGAWPVGGFAAQHEGHGASHDSDAQAELSGRPSFPEVRLVDQDGGQIDFFDDLVKGRVVAINFIFTTCTTICPPMGANFARLQKSNGDGDFSLISVSVDPVTDTPERLKAWRDKLGGGPGWTLVTGAKAEVDRLLKALQAFSADKWDHSPLVLIGNEANGQWLRANGLAPPETLLEAIAKVREKTP